MFRSKTYVYFECSLK